MSNIFKEIPLCEKLTDEQLFQYLFINQQQQIIQDLLDYISNITRKRAEQEKTEFLMSHVWLTFVFSSAVILFCCC